MARVLGVLRRSLGVALLAAALVGAAPSSAPAVLTIRFGDATRTFTLAQLAARSDAATIAIPDDVAYKRPMTFRAVPLLDLIDGLPYAQFDAVQWKARDGFVAELPTRLLARGDAHAVPWIAFDDPAQPWPEIPGRKPATSAGPFYLVWQHPERSQIATEQWVEQIADVTGLDSPVARWPQLGVGASASPQVHRGQQQFIAFCLPCHALNGAGHGTIGPDLGRPMNATVYMTDAGLRALIRDPKAVRTWPAQRMIGFGPKAISDADIDAIIAYLKYKR